MTRDGFFHRGRTDDIINPGGEKLSLIEVDEALLSHPDVIDAATIGIGHDRFGEVPAAFVTVRGAMTETELRDRLDEHCLATMEPWKRPRVYILTREVPRTAAKRSKLHGEMRVQLQGLRLRHEDGVLTVSELRERSTTLDEVAS